MDNHKLPAYPQHPEPNQRIESVEFERESRPRISPGMIVWMGLAMIIAVFFAQKYAAQYLGGDQVVPIKARPSGN